MHKKTRLVIGCLFLCFIFAVRYCVVNGSLHFASIKAQSYYFMSIVEQQYFVGVFMYCGLYITTILCALPIATVMTLLGGYLFGFVEGGLYAIVSATLGATGSFLVVRYCIGEVIQQKYKHRLVSFNNNIKEHGAKYLLLVRLVPIIPFFLINILTALTMVPIWTFVGITAVGIIPSAFVFSFMGQRLHAFSSVYDLFSLQTVLTFVLLAFFVGLSFVLRERYYAEK